MILAAGETPFHFFLETLAAESAVSPHLATKKCSLRFFSVWPDPSADWRFDVDRAQE
jgi:hypothetical protein